MTKGILTITLNPAVDFATTAPSVIPDRKLRCDQPEVDPGGGGINVARAIQQLNGHATALIAIGGSTGAQLLQLLALEGVPTVAFQGPGETRLSFSVIDESTEEQYRFVMPGPNWTQADLERALHSVDQAADEDTIVVLSGSQPPGAARNLPSILAKQLAGRGADLIADVSGPSLRQLATNPREPIFALRMNELEAAELAGRPLAKLADTAAFARQLVETKVADNVIIACGAEGSVLANANGNWHSAGPDVQIVSKVGAGDSFVGAFTFSQAKGEAPEQSLRFGVAAVSATLTTVGTKFCDLETTQKLLDDCTLQPL